ncbi:MAG: OsmC family peroxiredoxin [Gammaproteobacteria bacterium]|nr:OsmC family peroxiredoxin [Gammaproteobacteria bacterium]
MTTKQERLVYHASGTNHPGGAGQLSAKNALIRFDGSDGTDEEVPGPAELLVSSFAACVLKNVERFSHMLPFQYEEARIEVTAVREDAPPRMTSVQYALTIVTNESDRRVQLLLRNIEKFGTIYNTIALACDVTGSIRTVAPSTV